MAGELEHWQFLPADIPRPVDDGMCDHLPDVNVPYLALQSTQGSTVDLSSLPGLNIVFCFPRSGRPGQTVSDEWHRIPGARGCTPQACAFRDMFKELRLLGVNQVFGMSTQDTEYQQELKSRVHLPYDLLSDHDLAMATRLDLPTFVFEGQKLLKRATLAIYEGKVIKVWYPVYPSNKSPDQVIDWLKENDTTEGNCIV